MLKNTSVKISSYLDHPNPIYRNMHKIQEYLQGLRVKKIIYLWLSKCCLADFCNSNVNCSKIPSPGSTTPYVCVYYFVSLIS